MAFYYTVLLILQAILHIECSAFKHQGYTPLKINEIACTAEKLKSNGGRYTCDHEGNVHCSEGWEDEPVIDDSNRCAIPVCDANCVHGMCTSPNFCACEVGWDGTCCDICIPMPGCVNGMCRKETVNGVEVEIAQTCECERFSFTHVLTNSTYKYTGPRCDQPVCVPACENGGACVMAGDTNTTITASGHSDAGTCACPVGFTHDETDDAQQCSKCIKSAGCQHGECAHMDPNDSNSPLIPGTCHCKEGYTGPLCDQLQCKDSIGAVIDCGIHGKCEADMLPGSANGCVCEAGWQGENCEYCVPYWSCPNQNHNDTSDANGLACLMPNECWCKSGGPAVSSTDQHLCNNEDINGTPGSNGVVDPNE